MILDTRLTRRGFLSASALSLLALTACSTSARTSAGGEAFTYTDARGATITLDRLPGTVVAQSSVAAALWDNNYKVAGIYGELPDPLDYQTGNIDPSSMTVLGSTWGEFNIEKYAALEPDLLIDMTFDRETLWYATEIESTIADIAPTIGMPLTGLSVVEQIEAFTALARKLGATPTTATDEQAFNDATASVARAAQASPGLTVLALSAGAEQVWFANAAQHPDLAHLAAHGVTFAEVTPDESGIFEPASLENLAKYHADVILVDARSSDKLEALKDQPIWQNLPAVEAGQQYLWYPAAPYSYQTYAPLVRGYATHLEGARLVRRS